VLGGLGYQRRPWPTAVGYRLPVLMTMFGALLLAPAALGGIIALSVTIVAAGATLVPQVSTHNVLLDRVVAPQRLAEAYGWLTTMIAIANGAGQALGGVVIQHSDYHACFLAAGACVLGFAALVAARTSTLRA
jgi:predicted MFS family arabinose efflux permease